MRAVAPSGVSLYAADMDPYAAGLYLVPSERRLLCLAGRDPAFVDHILAFVAAHAITVFVPTVDVELMAVSRARARFEALGCRVLVASPDCLALCLDKHVLIEACHGVAPVPESTILTPMADLRNIRYPLLVKPRSGAGGRGVVVVQSPQELASCPQDGSCLVQEYLPGEEYSVDVLANADGHVVAAVPRARLKVDSGIAVTARSFHDAELEDAAIAVARRIGLTFTANIQFKRDRSGRAKLLEVNVRFPGTMPLTVHSGVNMPLLSIRTLLGADIPASMDFVDTALVRFWEEHIIAGPELVRLEAEAASRRTAGLATDALVAA
jgi:carbamoyl-phosphate synthase large subunit